MKKTQLIASLFFLMINVFLFSAGIAQEAAAPITAGASGAQLYPLTGHRALAVQFSDSEQGIELLLADASGVQKSIRIPYDKRGLFGFIPSSDEAPEFWIYDPSDHTVTWYAWKDDALLSLLQWEGWPSLIAKEEGLVLENDQYGSFVESLEFIDSQQQTLLQMPISRPNTVFEDVIWDEIGWILLSREISATNLYTVWRISRDGEILWTRELPEIKSADGFFTDGAGGLWMAYSPSYTGDMSLFHIDSDGAVDREVLLGGEPRVKYLYGSQTAAQGEVTVYGTSVANSKGIYHAFALTLNSSGDVLGLDVRNYTERKDYSIKIRQSADNTVYVCSESYENAAPLLVPFAGVQDVTDHGQETKTVRWGDDRKHEEELYYDRYLAEFPFEESGRAFYGIGTIDAGATKSIHLRELDDDSSQSFGEYYNGTKAVCVSDPSEPWVVVWIGNTIGSIRSDSLCFDANKSICTQFEYGEMLEDAILTSDPFFDTVPTFAGEEQLRKGQRIILLGRTNDDHYFADTGKGWGYVRCESVKMASGLSQN